MTVEDAAAPRHYNKAPIVEATLGIGVPISADQSDLLKRVCQALEGEYPTRLAPEDLIPAGLTPASVSPQDADDIYVLKSADGKYVVRFAKGRFSLSRLEPYDRWESFSDEFRRTWSIFEAVIQPAELNGFWVRYINKLRTPLNRSLRDFFNVYPAWPDPTTLFSQLFLLVETTIDAPPGSLMVYMLPVIDEADLDGGFVPIILGNTFTFKAESVDAVWRNMDAVRKAKNSVFNSQLTDEMKETIS
jgi:uncharacterized protein (TIGR04255 family)